MTIRGRLNHARLLSQVGNSSKGTPARHAVGDAEYVRLFWDHALETTDGTTRRGTCGCRTLPSLCLAVNGANARATRSSVLRAARGGRR